MSWVRYLALVIASGLASTALGYVVVAFIIFQRGN